MASAHSRLWPCAALLYLLHLPLIHGLSVLVNLLRFGRADWLYGHSDGVKPRTTSASAAGTYVAWLIVLLILYPVCRWFAELKPPSRGLVELLLTEESKRSRVPLPPAEKFL
jgi:hypothetical protein